MVGLAAPVLFGQRRQAEQLVPAAAVAVLVQALEIQLHLVVLVAYTEPEPAAVLLVQQALPVVVKAL
jgi:hypothetical protein